MLVQTASGAVMGRLDATEPDAVCTSIVVACELLDLGPIVGVVDASCLIGGATENAVIGEHLQAEDSSPESADLADLGGVGGLPDAHAVVSSPRDDLGVVAEPADGVDHIGVGVERRLGIAGLSVEDLGGLVTAGTGELGSIGRPRDIHHPVGVVLDDQLLSKGRGVNVVKGHAEFLDANTAKVNDETIRFQHAIIATGSVPVMPKTFAIDDPRVMDSTAALLLPDVPKTLLVVGGGYIGLEIGSIYAALGRSVCIFF